MWPRNQGVVSQGEDLRRAVRWISAHRPVSRQVIEAAGRRFDLSPKDEEFLLREFLDPSSR